MYINFYRNQDFISGLKLDPTSGLNLHDPTMSRPVLTAENIVMEREGDQVLVKIGTQDNYLYP